MMTRFAVPATTNAPDASLQHCFNELMAFFRESDQATTEDALVLTSVARQLGGDAMADSQNAIFGFFHRKAENKLAA
jgi:hypothetical protein